MILKGSTRGGASNLARHLGNTRDNDHVTIYEVRGFVARDLHGAFNEAHAIAGATNCKKFLYSLSFNPPKDKNVPVAVFLKAIERAEERLGLTGQPRAVVFHEKEGRRHAHAVWSRIDAKAMKAIEHPFDRTKLAALSKEHYLEQGWKLPRGHRENNWKNPLNFSLAEFQQAKRLDMDPREIKQVFHAAFTQSDSAKAFKAALEDSGYYLAKGDRRGFVAVDLHGEVYSAARWASVKTKQLKEKFGSPDELPSVAKTQANIKTMLTDKMRQHMAQMREDQHKHFRPFRAERQKLILHQRKIRRQLTQDQMKRWTHEAQARSNKYRSGLRGAYDLLTGKRGLIRKENEAEIKACAKRDRGEREDLFKTQHKARQGLQKRVDAFKHDCINERRSLKKRIAEIMGIKREFSKFRSRTKGRDNPKGRGRDGGPSLSKNLSPKL